LILMRAATRVILKRRQRISAVIDVGECPTNACGEKQPS